MSDQARAWSAAAARYAEHFIDPYRPDVRNPVIRWLERQPQAADWRVADLGCGTGPLLPLLVRRFRQVDAIDFAAGMLAAARERVGDVARLTFHQTSFTDLRQFHGSWDVAVAMNSLVLPDPAAMHQALAEIHRCLRPGGWFLGIVPALDGVQYYSQLLLHRAVARGLPRAAAEANAAHHAEHHLYDFAFGTFRFQGLEQHFWQREELRHRLRDAGFRRVQLRKIGLAWDQFALGQHLRDCPPTWDWAFLART